MLKRIRNILLIIVSLSLIFSTNINAHGGNITGWKDKDSTEITKYNGKYYGYHNENGVRHYHQVEWDEENEKWVIVNAAVYYDQNFNIIDISENIESEKIEVTYYASVDGDTAKFKLDDELITVRFLGIDTPETVHTQKDEQPYGKEASNYTKNRLENATKIEIEYDSKASEKDQYDRILAWVWVDDSLLQEELILNGLAKIYMLQNNYRYASVLQLAETEAKNNKINIWSEEETNEIVEESTVDNNIDIIALIFIIVIFVIAIIIGCIKKKEENK